VEGTERIVGGSIPREAYPRSTRRVEGAEGTEGASSPQSPQRGKGKRLIDQVCTGLSFEV